MGGGSPSCLRDVVLRELQFSHELRERSMGTHAFRASGLPSCLSRPANSPTRICRRTKTIRRRVSRISSGIKVVSFGIAFVTTVLARRAQYHQSVLVTHITNFHATFSESAAGIAIRFVDHGYSGGDAAVRAVAQVHAVVQQQASTLHSSIASGCSAWSL